MNAAALPLPLPCPFCAATKGQTVMSRDVSRDESPQLEQLVRLEGVRRVAVVVCTACGAQGAIVPGTPAEAIEAWNRRDWKPC